jgi:stearoyl-CoA desaturase (delta-9 desaturase)
VDTDRDPYNIKKGFFYAHIGWMIFWQHPLHYDNVRDLQASRLVRHQARFYVLWAAVAGIILPVLIGALTGHALGAFLLSVCARITLVYHITWCINSVCHTFGKATYDIYSSARDHWFAALITNGEGYHNYHHHFPGDYRNGVRWYQWDPTKWVIATLARIGFAWDLKRVSMFRILAAKLAAENQRVGDRLGKVENPALVALQSMLELQYEKLKQTLGEWERSAREYQEILRQHLERHSEARREAALKSLEARRRFQETLAQWKLICLQLLPI